MQAGIPLLALLRIEIQACSDQRCIILSLFLTENETNIKINAKQFLSIDIYQRWARK